MQISNETLSILKNFSAINSSLLLREGDIIHTISAGKNVFARAKVAEDFPSEVAIYDLPSLLGILTLGPDMDIQFGESSFHISKDNGSFEYFYADPNVLQPKAPDWPTKSPKTETLFTFQLTAQELQTIIKAAGIVEAKILSIVGDGNKVTINVGTPKISGTNTYKQVVGESDQEFTALLAFESLRVMPESYSINLSKRALHFSSESRDLQYWFALDPESKF